MVRDAARILCLRICSQLTYQVTCISQGKDVDISLNNIIVNTILLLKLMSFQLPEDRHRIVIDKRLQDIVGTNVL